MLTKELRYSVTYKHGSQSGRVGGFHSKEAAEKFIVRSKNRDDYKDLYYSIWDSSGELISEGSY